MQNIDFTKLAKKYPLLQSKDISFLNKFFNREDIQIILLEIEKERLEKIKKLRKKILMYISFFVISILGSFVVLYFSFNEKLSTLLIVSILVGSVLGMVTTFIVIMVSTFLNYKKVDTKSIKNNILPKFVEAINKNMVYSKGKEYFPNIFKRLVGDGFLKKYTRIDYIEDSIEYNLGENDNSIKINGCELKTSEKRTRRTKNGTSTYYVVTNHCYLTKISFNNPKYILKNSIKLLEDISNNIIKKIIKIAIIQAGIIFAFLNIISGDENTDGYIDEFFELTFSYWQISISFLVGMFFVIWFIYGYIRGKKRVKLENMDFEKEFDVFSDDGIETRKVLTPSFMYRIVDFVNKIDKNRVYEMYLEKNNFYIKYKLKTNNYLEFSKHKSILKNLENYIKFYLEIKNISLLSKELKLFYYDKGMMTKKLIK